MAAERTAERPREGRTWTQEEKERRTKAELARLRRIFKDMPGDRKGITDGLLREAAFMRATLEETREIIDREGIIERFEQGSQRFLREHPATKVYAAMVNRYTTVIRSLLDQIPDGDKQKDAAAELLGWVRSGT